MYVFIPARICIPINLELCCKGSIRLWRGGAEKADAFQEQWHFPQFKSECKCRLSIIDNENFNKHEVLSPRLLTGIYHVILNYEIYLFTHVQEIVHIEGLMLVFKEACLGGGPWLGLRCLESSVLLTNKVGCQGYRQTSEILPIHFQTTTIKYYQNSELQEHFGFSVNIKVVFTRYCGQIMCVTALSKEKYIL